MSLERYILVRFSGSKLGFRVVDAANGFSLIDDENRSEFINSFRNFEELDWNAIVTDKGGIIKIRKVSVISQMTYGKKALRNSESLSGTGAWVMWRMVFFYVLRFDLDHELSDVG